MSYNAKNNLTFVKQTPNFIKKLKETHVINTSEENSESVEEDKLFAEDEAPFVVMSSALEMEKDSDEIPDIKAESSNDINTGDNGDKYESKKLNEIIPEKSLAKRKVETAEDEEEAKKKKHKLLKNVSKKNKNLLSFDDEINE